MDGSPRMERDAHAGIHTYSRTLHSCFLPSVYFISGQRVSKCYKPSVGSVYDHVDGSD